MISAPQPSVVHLFTIFRQIGAGELRIPAFQREFVWKPRQIIELLNSVREQYPVGSILLWSVDRKVLEIASNRVTSFPDVPELYPTNYVLDGMQRLSSLYGTFHFKDGTDEIFDVRYDLRAKIFYHATDRSIYAEESSIPISSILSPRQLLEQQARIASLPDGDELLDEMLATQAAFQDYMIPIVKITGAEVERVVGIFERTNSTGTRLDTVDFMRAITWNQNFDLNHFLDQAHSSIEDYGFELFDETIIKCIGLLLSVDPSDDGLLSLRSRSAADLISAFQEFPRKIKVVFDFLRNWLKIENMAYVPYEGQILVLFKALAVENERDPDTVDALTRWFWAAGFNESLRGKPDHYVVKAVDNWRAMLSGRLRGLEPRLRLNAQDFQGRRLITGKALSGAFAAMFAHHKAKSLITGDVISASAFMSASDLTSFQSIFDRSELARHGYDVGPSARIFPNIILSNSSEEMGAGADWRQHIVRMFEDGREDVLASQFINEQATQCLLDENVQAFLDIRSQSLWDYAHSLVDDGPALMEYN